MKRVNDGKNPSVTTVVGESITDSDTRIIEKTMLYEINEMEIPKLANPRSPTIGTSPNTTPQIKA